MTVGISINLSQLYKACEPKGISEALHVTMWIISSQWSCNFLNLQMRPLTYMPDTLKITSQCPPFNKSDTRTSNNEYNEIKCLLNMWVQLDGVVMTVNRQWAGWSRVNSCQWQKIFLFSITLRLALRPTQLPIQWVLGGILHEGTGTGEWSWPFISEQ